jgi:hypothetical protein
VHLARHFRESRKTHEEVSRARKLLAGRMMMARIAVESCEVPHEAFLHHDAYFVSLKR